MCIDSKKDKYRVLSSDRVVGDPGQWNVVKDSRPVTVLVPLVIKNKFDALIHNEEERIYEETLQVPNPANDNIKVQNKESTTVVVVPTVVQEDNSQRMIVQRESRNKILHDIISHNVEEKVLLEIEAPHHHQKTTMVKEEETEVTDNTLDVIAKDADLSPRMLNAARRSKKQGDGENIQHIKTQRKRNKLVTYR
ncbi:hypothetical protein R3W88_016212 [Solanum pinnatisectum]|uniref:Uncharacterized protein n=1 Tax=Solanum pinnatisectum TaxID=50273 RepID=A0AAV9KZ58_9SOLN|nr:hypothetical protein R3W88_016212 [Solanum pinnatisectum]